MILDEFKGEEIIESKTLDTKVNTTQPFIADIDKSWITFGNITCHAADGSIIESYPRVQLARYVAGDDGKGTRTCLTRDLAVESLNKGRYFLPSAPLTLNCLLAAHTADDKECDDFVREYFSGDYGTTALCFASNTLVHWQKGTIVHNEGSDFATHFSFTPLPRKAKGPIRSPYAFTRMERSDHRRIAQNMMGCDLTALDALCDAYGVGEKIRLGLNVVEKQSYVSVGSYRRNFVIGFSGMNIAHSVRGARRL